MEENTFVADVGLRERNRDLAVEGSLANLKRGGALRTNGAVFLMGDLCLLNGHQNEAVSTNASRRLWGRVPQEVLKQANSRGPKRVQVELHVGPRVVVPHIAIPSGQ